MPGYLPPAKRGEYTEYLREGDECTGQSQFNVAAIIGLEPRRTSRLLLGPPSGSRGSSYTRTGASPCLISDSKKSIPSSAGVFGVLVIVGDEPADEAGEMCLFFWIVMVGWGNALATLEAADLTFAAITRGWQWREDDGEMKET